MCCECDGGCDCDPNDAMCTCPNPIPDEVTPDGDDVTPDGDDVTPDGDDVTPVPGPDPAQTCWSNDANGTLFDRDGSPYNCSYYDTPGNEGGCGQYDDDDFIANDLCCGCDGGCACDPNDVACACGGDDDQPVPDPEEPHVVEFNLRNLDGDMALNATELEQWWNATHGND